MCIRTWQTGGNNKTVGRRRRSFYPPFFLYWSIQTHKSRPIYIYNPWCRFPRGCIVFRLVSFFPFFSWLAWCAFYKNSCPFFSFSLLREWWSSSCIAFVCCNCCIRDAKYIYGFPFLQSNKTKDKETNQMGTHMLHGNTERDAVITVPIAKKGFCFVFLWMWAHT
jgi:hypothetical protein